MEAEDAVVDFEAAAADFAVVVPAAERFAAESIDQFVGLVAAFGSVTVVDATVEYVEAIAGVIVVIVAALAKVS